MIEAVSYIAALDVMLLVCFVSIISILVYTDSFDVVFQLYFTVSEDTE